MPKTNTRAIGKLLEAHKVLKKLGRSNSALSAGQAFAENLIKLLEKGKPMTLAIGNGPAITFKPDDVKVSRTRVMIGKAEISLSSLQNGAGGAYELTEYDTSGNEITGSVTVRLGEAERIVA